MQAWLILFSIATNSINTPTKLSYTVSTWSPTQSNPIQNNKFTNFDDSPSFGLLYKKLNAENMHPIFETSTLIPITKLDSLCIKPSPGERFIPIANVLRHLYAFGYSSAKMPLLFKNITSQMMGIIFWTHLIW